jgi:hypothetical protein
VAAMWGKERRAGMCDEWTGGLLGTNCSCSNGTSPSSPWTRLTVYLLLAREISGPNSS